MSVFESVRRASKLFLPGSLIAIFLLGCGDPEVGAPQIVTSEIPPSPTPIPEPTPTPEPVEIDFASLEEFPDLEFVHSSTLSPQDTRDIPVMDLTEYTEEQVWWTVAPATFELTLPAGATVHRIEVEGAEGESAFPECVVFVRSATETEWRRPSGLELEHRMGDFVEGKGYRIVYVYTFEETPAVKVLVGIAKGSREAPGKVAVRDIDVFGYLDYE